MASFDNLMLKLDEAITSILGDWDIYTTSIAAVIISVFAYSVFTRRDPDVHPILLERQTQGSLVRNHGESAVYRSQSSPHGMDLNTGLNVRDPGINKWARGRDGDLRDVWRRVVTGPTDDSGNTKGKRGELFTVLGTEQVLKHNLEEITTQIVRIGKHFQQHGGSRVAIYLPNSVEFLTALFACNFYDLTPILLPYDQPAETLISMLQRSKADTMIGAVGTLPFEAVTREYAGLRQLIWVLDKGNKHMHWDEVPKGTGGEVNVLTWQEITGEKQGGMELPPLDAKSVPKGVVSFWQSRKTDEGQLVEYSQANLVSAISAQLSAIPVRERINSDDLFLPVDSLSTVYTLVLTLAALYYNSSVALNSVAGRDADISAATAGISPTIIVAPASTVSKLHEESSSKLTSPLHRLVHWFQTGTLTQNGVMPSHSLLTAINNGARPKLGATPGKLRMLFTSEQLNGDSPPLTPAQLSDLRIFTGARVIYALTGPKVAGAVTQTAFYDYRIENPQKQSHFGAPLSSVEMLLRDVKGFKTTDESAMGEIVVRGPAVVGGGEARMGAVGVLRGDGCLAYV